MRSCPVTPRAEVRAQDELSCETARFQPTMRLGNPIERDPLGDAGPDGARREQAKEMLQVLPEPGGMACPHDIDRVEAGMLAARQQPPQIQARNRYQDGEHA